MLSVLSMRKYRADPNWRMIYKIPDQYSSRVVSVMRNKERDWGNWGRSMEPEEMWQLKACEMQGRILDQKMDIRKTEETQVNLCFSYSSTTFVVWQLCHVSSGCWQRGVWVRSVMVCSLCKSSLLSPKLFQYSELKIHNTHLYNKDM